LEKVFSPIRTFGVFVAFLRIRLLPKAQHCSRRSRRLGSVIMWLTDAALASAAEDLLSGYSVVAPDRAIQLRGAADEFNGLVDALVHQVWRRLSFPDSSKLGGGRRVGHEWRTTRIRYHPTANTE
jgi:hypothetical protein